MERAFAAACLLLAALPAADGRTFTDDFDSGLRPEWQGVKPPAERIVTKRDNGVLHLGKGADGGPPGLRRVTIRGAWRDFCLEAHVMKTGDGWAGLVFRDRYELYLSSDKARPANRCAILRKNYRVIAHAKVDHRPGAYYHLRIVCIGRRLRAFADGAMVIDFTEDADPVEGVVGVLSHATEAQFDNFRVTEDIPPDAALMLKPAPPGGVLLFAPDRPIRFDVEALNESTGTWSARLAAKVFARSVADRKPVVVAGLDADPATVSVAQDEGRPAIRIGGDTEIENSRVGYLYVSQWDRWRDFHLQCALRAPLGAAGFFFHRSQGVTYETYFAEDGRFVLRKILPGWKVKVLGVSSPLPKNRCLPIEIFRRDAHLAVFVDGKRIFRFQDDSSTSGRIGLMSHSAPAFFRDLRITNVLPAKQGLDFPAPGRPAPARTWRAEPGRTPPQPQPLAETSAPVEIGPASNSPAAVEFPALAEGYYLLGLDLLVEGRAVQTVRYPLCVWTPPAPAGPAGAAEQPFFPLIVYGKGDMPRDQVSADTYLHAVCRTLREAGLNGIIHTFSRREQLDILSRYGLRAALRGKMIEWADHPAVCCVLVGDEPGAKHIKDYRKRTDELKAHAAGRPLITCMVGDAIGSGGQDDPLRTWGALDPDIHFFRAYCIRKDRHDLLNSQPGQWPMARIFESVAALDAKPWWFVVQAFGQNVCPERPAPYWRNPNAAEMRAMVNLALAYGAKGLFFYTLQDEGIGPALVKPHSLLACDDKLGAVARAAGRIERLKPILVKLRPAEVEVRSDAHGVVARAHRAGDSLYVYVVNQATGAAQQAKLCVAGVKVAAAVDVETGKPQTASPTAAGLEIRLSLEPGEGRLLELQ